ncbi:hypothetical protein AB0E81_10415 [Streptomyces sp. NPDC033538]|uniref:hypothetical protein n=1 Tax=Streptomyces sp. NPDC033538 TaxID=3155367 RepID=UPI0033CB85CD
MDDLEYVNPRVRAMPDLAYMRMAVVLRDLDARTTHTPASWRAVTTWTTSCGWTTRRGGAEENAATSPDGRSVERAYRLLSMPVEDRFTHVAGAPVHCPVAACGSRVS